MTGTYERRAWRAHARHIQFRDEYAKAYRVVARYPLYTIQGGANHGKLNGDLFGAEERKIVDDYIAKERESQAFMAKMDRELDADIDAEIARFAKQYQDAERRAEMQAVVDGVMGGET